MNSPADSTTPIALISRISAAASGVELPDSNPPTALKPRAVCPPAIIPGNLIYQGESLTVWLSETLDIWWETKDPFENKDAQFQSRPEWGEVMGKEAELEALPMFHMTKEEQRGFRTPK